MLTLAIHYLLRKQTLSQKWKKPKRQNGRQIARITDQIRFEYCSNSLQTNALYALISPPNSAFSLISINFLICFHSTLKSQREKPQEKCIHSFILMPCIHSLPIFFSFCPFVSPFYSSLSHFISNPQKSAAALIWGFSIPCFWYGKSVNPHFPKKPMFVSGSKTKCNGLCFDLLLSHLLLFTLL